MKQKKIISLPTNEEKIYKQILAFLSFMMNITSQERDILAELIRLDNEYEVLPPDKRGKFILSTDMRKEIQKKLNIKEKQFNVLISKLKNDPKKFFLGKPLIDENNILHSELKWKPDNEGFTIEINFVMTTTSGFMKKIEEAGNAGEYKSSEITTEKTFEKLEENIVSNNVPPTEYKYDASQAPVIEEEEFNISLTPRND